LQNIVFMCSRSPTSPGTISTFMPRACGTTRMSEKMMAASRLNRLIGGSMLRFLQLFKIYKVWKILHKNIIIEFLWKSCLFFSSKRPKSPYLS
jgi:hypothetical protein